VRFELVLESGEAVFLNNYEILHSGTALDDWAEPERRRLLLRLWLQGRPPEHSSARYTLIRMKAAAKALWTCLGLVDTSDRATRL
jgi:hypothetical protein